MSNGSDIFNCWIVGLEQMLHSWGSFGVAANEIDIKIECACGALRLKVDTHGGWWLSRDFRHINCHHSSFCRPTRVRTSKIIVFSPERLQMTCQTPASEWRLKGNQLTPKPMINWRRKIKSAIRTTQHDFDFIGHCRFDVMRKTRQHVRCAVFMLWRKSQCFTNELKIWKIEQNGSSPHLGTDKNDVFSNKAIFQFPSARCTSHVRCDTRGPEFS